VPQRKRAAATIAPRKTLLEWIDYEDGDTTEILAPSCSPQVQALHAKILVPGNDRQAQPADTIQPPPGLWLPPLG
jgi:hypothetical protein